jgi:hypothetical protein
MGFSNYTRIVFYVTVEWDLVKEEFDGQHDGKTLCEWLREKLASKYSVKCVLPGEVGANYKDLMKAVDIATDTSLTVEELDRKLKEARYTCGDITNGEDEYGLWDEYAIVVLGDETVESYKGHKATTSDVVDPHVLSSLLDDVPTDIAYELKMWSSE